MVRSLLSIDWDYFIPLKKEWLNSYTETQRNIEWIWYKRHLESYLRGIDIEKSVSISYRLDDFWDKIREHFIFAKDIEVYVSESHMLSYHIAINNKCEEVYSLDTHADLGYGGISSVNFKLNCANWMGKLLSEGRIKKAHIVYSHHTTEKPEDFKDFNKLFPVRYYNDIDELPKGIYTAAIHICRSGAWTPPWLDDEFFKLVNNLNLPYKVVKLYKRKWDIEKTQLSDLLYYLNFS
ncbi:arginase [Thermoanaerobacterium sp. R66]|uniref:arginase n=1 Tax=Thermoanaerobacterium sp. R66 TaxID=2742479 RepID=UPI0023801540|nr:arginase [Thermoanaerobacterium sp. R66]MDE4542391.1 arginase [Thermoanaerobacterium sp. R66]